MEKNSSFPSRCVVRELSGLQTIVRDRVAEVAVGEVRLRYGSKSIAEKSTAPKSWVKGSHILYSQDLQRRLVKTKVRDTYGFSVCDSTQFVLTVCRLCP